MICTPTERDLIVAGATRLVAPGAIDPATFSATGGAFVAPRRWVDATGPCPTCEGQCVSRSVADPHPGNCRDCIDGRKREALQVWAPMLTDIGPNPELGAVTFAYATVEVLSVGDTSSRPFIQVYHDRCVLRRVADPSYTTTWEELALDPLPVPGRDWVVLLDNVELT